MNNKIHEKYELIDLARYGSSARKDIRPKLYVASGGKYEKGDILDANLQASILAEAISDSSASMTNYIDNKSNVIVNYFNDTLNNKFLFYETKAEFELNQNNIPNSAVAFIKDKQLIWANGVFYSGGGGVGDNVEIDQTPIYYYVFANKNTLVPENTNGFTTINVLSPSKQTSITLQNKFLFLAVPNNIILTRAVTSRFEELSLSENFSTDTTTITGYKVWIYKPAVAPENLTITFTFTVS